MKKYYECADGMEVMEGMPVWYFDMQRGYIDQCRCDSDNLDIVGTYSASYSNRQSCKAARDAFFATKDVAALIGSIKKWGENKGLLTECNAIKQLGKITEELGEVAGAFLKGDKDGLRLDIGDLIVTIILFATQNGFDINECLAAAYNKIKDRQGKTVDGVFVKAEDL